MRKLCTPLLLLIVLAGCAQTDPYRREGAWHPNGANDSNLRAMIVVPSDLVLGARASPTAGELATAPMSRLYHDKVRPLPDTGLAQIVPVSSGSAPPAAAPAPASGQ
jgi:hypothetical protein